MNGDLELIPNCLWQAERSKIVADSPANSHRARLEKPIRKSERQSFGAIRSAVLDQLIAWQTHFSNKKQPIVQLISSISSKILFTYAQFELEESRSFTSSINLIYPKATPNELTKLQRRSAYRRLVRWPIIIHNS